ncbi:hypothetical protein [Methylobacterium sp. J-059]|uniref:hypothetical protein n=1 Tax=Methylobacterium sp. J-059 TaxID=2836643 RepID=UPI00391D3C9C
MARPWKDPKTGTDHLRQRPPRDLAARVKGTRVMLHIGARPVLVTVGADANRKQVLASSPFPYEYRNRVERFFGKIKHARAVATRYDTDPDNSLASVKRAAVRVRLRAL